MIDEWQVRPSRREDLAAVAAIFRAQDLYYRGRSEMDLDRLTERIDAHPGFVLERDQVIVEVAGAPVATATVNPFTVNLAICPEHESVDLRRVLLTWAEGRETELGRDRFRVAVYAAETPAVSFLLASGYALERFYALMTREFAGTGPSEPPVMPDGYRLRRVDPRRDLTALHQLNERAFGERPDHEPETEEQYGRDHLTVSRFAPSWSLIMESDRGEAVGSVIGEQWLETSTGYVALLAVDPGHRRCGIGSHLLSVAFDAIQRAGLRQAELHVASDNRSALDIYVGLGMRQGERLEDYVRRSG